MSESALSFLELQTHMAIQLGVAYYGAAGTTAAAPPQDAPTLQQVKDYVNGGIRMFLLDAPRSGWRFQQPTASITLWATATSTANGAPSKDNGTSTVTVDGAIFYPEMVGHNLVFSATSNSYAITAYTSTTVVTVSGDASSEADGDTVTITADGNYTLPATFGGEYSGSIRYEAGTNAGTTIRWIDEGTVRRRRENEDSQTGYPYLAAVRKMDATNVARRWELVVWPIPSSNYVVEFPYELYFTELTADADLHPCGAHYDEAILAACEAYAEMKGEDRLAGRSAYYQQKVLPAAHRRNRRSAPKRLGSLKRVWTKFENWRDYVRRPDVTTP